MWAKIITIKRTKYLNYFSLCALNLFNTRVSQFELNYWNKRTFPQHSNLLRCTCVCINIIIYYYIIYIILLLWWLSFFLFVICLNKIVYNSKSSHLLCVSHQIVIKKSAIGIGQQIFNICGFLVVIIIICILYIYTFLMNCLKSVNVCDQL